MKKKGGQPKTNGDMCFFTFNVFFVLLELSFSEVFFVMYRYFVLLQCFFNDTIWGDIVCLRCFYPITLSKLSKILLRKGSMQIFGNGHADLFKQILYNTILRINLSHDMVISFVFCFVDTSIFHPKNHTLTSGCLSYGAIVRHLFYLFWSGQKDF